MVSKVKLLYIIGTLDIGGAEGQLVQLVTRLDQQRFEPVVCCLTSSGPYHRTLDAAGIPVRVIGFKGLRVFRHPLQVATELSGLVDFIRREQPTIVHAFLFWAYVIGAFVARAAGVPIVIASRRSLGNFKEGLLHHLLLERLANRMTDLILANSEAVKADVIRQERMESGKVRVIYNGVDSSRHALPAEPGVRASLDIPLDAKTVGVIARLFDYKGHRYFLQACPEIKRRHPRAMFLFVGDGPEAGSLAALSRQLGLQEAVRFLGTRSDIPQLLSLLDVVALPSLEEGFPNVVLEAMAASKPVVATRVGGIPEAVIHEETGLLVTPENPQALAEGILRLLDDPTRAEAMGRAGRELVIRKFGMDRMVQETEQLYLDLLAAKGGALIGTRKNAEMIDGRAGEVSGGGIRPADQEAPGLGSNPDFHLWARSVWAITRPAIPWLVCLLTTYLIVWDGLAAPMGLWLRYDHFAVPFTVGAIAWTIFRFCGSASTTSLIAFLLCITLVVLFGTWQAGVTDGITIAGLFPYSDAQGYFTDALRLLHGQKFSAFSSRRPLFPVFLTGILGITGLDLRLTLCILTGLVALTIGLAAREVQRALDPVSGALALICLFMFYRRYIGSTLTEQIGLVWGCLAFSLIWRAAVEVRPRLAVLGLFFLSLALNARAGAFFILPAIILWAGWVFRAPKGFSYWVASRCAAAILLGFGVNGLMAYLVGTPNAAFSNFSYTLYGLVSGGNWTSALHNHPELATLAPVEQANRVYFLAWEQIRANPLVLLTGSLRAWTAFFVGHSGSWSSHFLYPSPEWTDARMMLQTEGVVALFRQQPVRVLLDVAGGKIWTLWLNVLLVTGLIVAWRHRHQRLVLLTILSWAGILVSVPFVPPWDADSMRAYAATLPFMIALPCLGVLYDVPNQATIRRAGEQRAPSGVGNILRLGALLLVVQVSVPLMLPMLGGSYWSSVSQRAMCAARCDSATEGRALHIIPGAIVYVRESTQGSVGRSGNYVSLQDIRTRTHAHEPADVLYMWRGLSRLGGETTLLSAYDLKHGTTLYVQSSSTASAQFPAQVSACGKTIHPGRIEWFQVYTFAACRIDEAQPIVDPRGLKSEGAVR